MTETRCRYAGSDQPRVLVDRHRDDCAGDCRGCQPCDRAHCRICGVEHSAGACPGCLAAIRDNLGEIRRMVAALPAEVRHRGIDSEAMVLAGPVADPESWEHHAASALAGRIVPADCDARDLDDLRDWLDRAEGEHHPAWVLGTWEMVVRDHLGHETDAAFAVTAAIGYLDQQLTAVAADPLVPVEDMARDLRRCVTHMERVLHDGEQIETGAPCMECERALVRVWRGGALPWTHRDGSQPYAADDGWACRRCRDWRSEADYRLNVAHQHRRKAAWLTSAEMIERTNVTRGSLSGWASKGKVAKKMIGGRVVYRVADVQRMMGHADDAA